MGTYSAKAIANEFLSLAESENESIAPMKIQKLVFLAHGWSLGLLGKPLISDSIQAWMYGPVIESIYHEFKQYGRCCIPSGKRATNISFDQKGLRIKRKTPEIEDDDSDAKDLVAEVWGAYKKYNGPQLSNLTHLDGTPWKECYKEGLRGIVIPDHKIKAYYKKLAEQQS